MNNDEMGDWRRLDVGASAWFDASSHTAGAALVRRIAELVSDEAGLPDVDLRASGVRVRVGASASPDLAQADIALARAISADAQDLGLSADPAALQALRLVIDALDSDSVMPFWSTVLGYEHGDGRLIDPLRRHPTIGFRAMDEPRPLRNRFHFDIGVPFTTDVLASPNLTGAVETFRADYYGTVADPDGNEVCLPAFGAAHLGEGAELADWRAIGSAIVFYPTTSFRQSAELAVAVAGLADEIGKPLMVDVRPNGVIIDSGKDQQEDENFDLDKRFAELARRVQATARRIGLTADPTPRRFIQIAIDAVDIPGVRAFWTTVLGYQQDSRWVQDIIDPRRLNPVFWFQQMDADDHARREQRNRIHVDLFVPHDQAQARITAALATGGEIAHDNAPYQWTLVDPEKNEIDILTSEG